MKFNHKLLKGKTIDELDERFFRLDGNDEIILTPYAENKILTQMKDFYGKQLKNLSIKANDTRYVTKIVFKEVEDKQASYLIKQEYQYEYGPIYEELEKLKQEYRDTHPDEFELVEITDPATYKDEYGNYVSVGGNLYHLKVSSIDEAAIGYATASQLLNDVDKSSFPTKKEYTAKDRTKWIQECKVMQEKVLEKHPEAPKDLFNVKIMKEDYDCRINGAKTKDLSVDESILEDVANEYVKTMMEKL